MSPATISSLPELLHPDFVEIGASSTVWTFEATPVAEGVVLVTFRLTGGPRTSLRSSLWVRGDDDRWQVRFHQGTVSGERSGRGD